MVQTLKRDIKKIKSLIHDDEDKKIMNMCRDFLPEYNLKILDGLNGYEKMRWMKANNC